VRLCRGMSPSRGRPSQGSRASRSAPSDVAASLVRRALPPPSRCEVLRRPACPGARRRRNGSHRLRHPLRVRVALPSPGPLRARDHPSWGFAPLQRLASGGSVSPGFASPGTFRPRGLSPPRRLSPPLSSRAHDARCRSWGLRFAGSFERRGRDVLPRPRCPVPHGAFQSRPLRKMRSDAPRGSLHLSLARPGSTAVVPELGSPLRSTSSPGRRNGFRRCWSPHAP